MLKGLTGHGGVVQHLVRDHLTQKLVLGQLVLEVVVIGQLFDLAHAMHHDDLLKLFVGLWVTRHAQERRQTGTAAQQVQVFAGQEVINQQGASGLAAHHNLVAHLDVLQLGGERTVLHLDAQELKVFFVVGADNRISAQKRLAVVLLQANHGEVTVGKTQGRVPSGGEAEQTVCPVVYA